MRIDIFCESGESYGLGHFYRSLKLIALLSKLPYIHAITLHNRGDYTQPPLKTLLDSTPLHIELECKNYEWLSTQPEMLELAIVDSYETQEWFYHRLAQHSKALICLDDTLRDVYPKDCYILNPTPDSALHFKGYSHLWCGEEYMILPHYIEFQQLESKHSKPTTHKQNKQVFVNFGGADSNNLSQSFIDLLADLLAHQLGQYQFHLVLGGGYRHKIAIPKPIENAISIYHNLPPSEFLHLASICDYALSAGGGSMLELLRLKIPSIILQTASNQAFHIEQWQKKGVIYHAKDLLSALETLKSWQENPPKILEQNLNNLSLGTKLESALLSLIQNLSKPHSTPQHLTQKLNALPFPKLSSKQSQAVLQMRNHPNIAKWMYAAHISPESHTAFLANLANDNTKRYWLLEENDEYIGVGSLTRINLAHRHAFIGIYKNVDSRISHKGAKILHFLESYAFNELNLRTLHLEVLEHNTQAIAFYKKMGYTEEGILHDFIREIKDSKSIYHNVILMYKERV